MSEKRFVKELRDSITYLARANGFGQAPTWKLHGSAHLSSMPDILGVYYGTTFFIECKVREMPKRKFDLMAGLTAIQRATLRSITDAGGHAFLAVRLENNFALMLSFRKWKKAFKEFPKKIMITTYFDWADYGLSTFRITKQNVIWKEIGGVISAD